jgi:hypothetical protein
LEADKEGRKQALRLFLVEDDRKRKRFQASATFNMSEEQLNSEVSHYSAIHIFIYWFLFFFYLNYLTMLSV